MPREDIVRPPSEQPAASGGWIAATLRWMWEADDDTGLRELFTATLATWIFLAVVSAISLADLALGPSGSGADQLTHYLGFSPTLVASGDWFRLVTQTLVNSPTHSSGVIGHLLSNAVGLVFVGPRVERAFGPLRFVVLVVVAQLCASVSVFVSVPAYLVAGGGTSGALFGLISAALVVAISRRRRSQGDAIYLGVAVALITVTWLMGLADAPAEPNISHLGGFLAGGAIASTWCARRSAKAGTVLAVALFLLAGSLAAARTADARRSDLAVVAETPVGFPPVMVTPGFGSVWVTGGWAAGEDHRGELVRIDETTGHVSARIRERGIGGFPVVTKDRVWVGAKGGVVAIDPTSNRIVSRIRIAGAWPYSVAATKDAIWAALVEPGEVVRVDLQTQEQKHIAAGAEVSFVLSAHGSHVWATSYRGQTVARLDPTTGSILEQRRLATGPYQAAFLDGSLWVGAQPFVYRLHPQSLDVIAKINVGREIWTLAPDAQGNLLVAQRFLRSIVWVDPETNKVERRAEVGLRQPISAVAIGDEIWIADPYSSVIVRTSSRASRGTRPR